MDDKVGPRGETIPSNPTLTESVVDYQLSDMFDMAELNLLLDNFCNAVGICVGCDTSTMAGSEQPE